MELRHLRYFVAVAEELNLTRAAARLCIGQPPLSQQIKDFEVGRGVTLLRRVPHGAELTEAGRMFLEEACGVRRQRERYLPWSAQREGSLAGSGLASPVRRISITWCPRRSATSSGVTPDVDIQMQEAHTDQLISELQSGALDVAIMHSRLDGVGGLRLVTVDREPLVVALPIAHSCAAEAAVRLAALADDKFIMKPRHIGPELPEAVVKACRS